MRHDSHTKCVRGARTTQLTHLPSNSLLNKFGYIDMKELHGNFINDFMLIGKLMEGVG